MLQVLNTQKGKQHSSETEDLLLTEDLGPRRLDSEARKQGTSFRSLESFFLNCSPSLKQAIDPEEEISLQRGGRVNNELLNKWVCSLLLVKRQRYESVRATYVPQLFFALEFMAIVYPEDAKVIIKNKMQQLRVSNLLLPSQICVAPGKPPLTLADIASALDGCCYTWENLLRTVSYLLLGISSGHRYLSQAGIQMKDIKLVRCNSRGWAMIDIFYKVTKGNDPDFPHSLLFEGKLCYDESSYKSDLVYWLHLYLKSLGFENGSFFSTLYSLYLA